MAEIEATSALTMVELAKRLWKGTLLPIAETLSKRNRILEDAIWVECNKEEAHIFNQRIVIPTGTWREVNYGVSEEASVTRQVEEGCAMLEAYSTIDVKIVELAGNERAFRAGEDKAFLEGLMQTFGTALVYSNIALTPEKIQGWATRYGSTGTMVKSASGSGSDTTSVWIVQWGEDRCHMLYPRGSKIGMDAKDLGEQTVLDGASNPYQAYRTHLRFHPGFAVHDDRCIGRQVNIESAGAANLFDPDQLVKIRRELLDEGVGSVIYANSTVLAQIDIQAMDKANVFYTMKDVFGKQTMHFQGIPVKRFAQITITETSV